MSKGSEKRDAERERVRQLNKEKREARRQQKRAGGVHRRALNSRPTRETFLIVCEGIKTEPNYFRSFRVPGRIEIVGTGANTKAVVKEAKRIDKNKGPFDQVWCVFDRDDFGADRFEAAIREARQRGYHVAYSNEAFELWYLLHFDYHEAALSRAQYGPILTEKLGRPYRKNDRDLRELLRDREATAILNAEKLLSRYKSSHPAHDNPSTTVHQLVDALREAERQ